MAIETGKSVEEELGKFKAYSAQAEAFTAQVQAFRADTEAKKGGRTHAYPKLNTGLSITPHEGAVSVTVNFGNSIRIAVNKFALEHGKLPHVVHIPSAHEAAFYAWANLNTDRIANTQVLWNKVRLETTNLVVRHVVAARQGYTPVAADLEMEIVKCS